MKKLKLAIMFLLVAGLCAGAMAQTPVGAPSPSPLPVQVRATDGQIATLLDVMRVRDQMSEILNLMPMVMQQQMSTLSEKFRGLRLTPEQEGKVAKFMQRSVERSLNLYPVEDVIKDAGTVYQKYISREDADALIAFYRTPAAQNLLQAQPVMTQELLSLTMGRLETFARAFAEEISREAQELIKELSMTR